MVDINAKISAIMINVFNVTRNSAQEKTWKNRNNLKRKWIN
jgi:hypothetical protein